MLDDDLRDEIATLSDQIADIIRGKSAQVQGTALADIVSMHLAGYHPSVRGKMIESWIRLMQQLIEVSLASIAERYGEDPWKIPTEKSN